MNKLDGGILGWSFRDGQWERRDRATGTGAQCNMLGTWAHAIL